MLTPKSLVVNMFAWHLQKLWSLCLPAISITHQGCACTYFGPIWVNSQQPMGRLAFEVISQSETKSAQSRNPRRKREREQNVKYNGHFIALAHALRSDQFYVQTPFRSTLSTHDPKLSPNLPYWLPSHKLHIAFLANPPSPTVCSPGL